MLLKEEKIIIGKGTEYPLNGLLTIPDRLEQNIPAVVIVHGSGPSDMDGTYYANKTYKDIATLLAKHGIAVLRYDKRTHAHKKKWAKEDKIHIFTVYEEVIEDAVRAANLLYEDKRIGKVFIFGHSMGGQLAPRIDACGGNFHGLIIAAGSPRTIRELMAEQMDDAARNYKGLLGIIARWQIKKIKPKLSEMDNWNADELKTKKFLGSKGAGHYFKDMEDNPPSLYLKNMTKPLFILQGDKDFQVKTETDFAGYQAMLYNHPDVSFKIYKGLNHIFTTSHGTNTVKDYKIPGTVSSQVTDDVAAWIHRVADL